MGSHTSFTRFVPTLATLPMQGFPLTVHVQQVSVFFLIFRYGYGNNFTFFFSHLIETHPIQFWISKRSSLIKKWFHPSYKSIFYLRVIGLTVQFFFKASDFFEPGGGDGFSKALKFEGKVSHPTWNLSRSFVSLNHSALK